MSYILNGQYYTGEPPMDKLQSKQSSTFKQWDQNRQRKDHAKEILQPFKNGKVNEDYLNAYPEMREVYGKDSQRS